MADRDAGEYDKWRVERGFVLVPAQSFVGEHLQTYVEFPPRQKPGKPFRGRCGCGAEIPADWTRNLYCLPDRLSETRSAGSEESNISFGSRVMGSRMGSRTCKRLTSLRSRRAMMLVRGTGGDVCLWHEADLRAHRHQVRFWG
jgi:hypothetical protein